MILNIRTQDKESLKVREPTRAEAAFALMFAIHHVNSVEDVENTSEIVDGMACGVTKHPGGMNLMVVYA